MLNSKWKNSGANLEFYSKITIKKLATDSQINNKICESVAR